MVVDEIENALSYYRTTFLHGIPRLMAEMEEDIAAVFPTSKKGKAGTAPAPLAPFLQMGSWIGGDRDGNPNVTGETLQHAAREQSQLIMAWYLDELHALGAELSMSSLMVDVSPGADRAGGCLAGPFRPPFRRTVPPRTDRHVRTAGRHLAEAHRPRGPAPPGGRRGAVRQRRGVRAPMCRS